MRERGFALAGLLASPTAWLLVGCALLSFTTWAATNRWQAAKQREAQVRAEYAAFVAQVKLRGEQAEKEKAKIEADWKIALQERSKRYEKQLANLRSERDAAQRVLDHYASSGGGAVPGVPQPPGASGPGQSDTVPRAALEQLARDAQVTTLLFNDCRDSWKALTAAR